MKGGARVRDSTPRRRPPSAEPRPHPTSPDGLADVFAREDELRGGGLVCYEAYVRDSLESCYYKMGALGRGDAPWGTSDRVNWHTAWIPALAWRVQVPGVTRDLAQVAAGRLRAAQVILVKVDQEAYARRDSLGPVEADTNSAVTRETLELLRAGTGIQFVSPYADIVPDVVEARQGSARSRSGSEDSGDGRRSKVRAPPKAGRPGGKLPAFPGPPPKKAPE